MSDRSFHLEEMKRPLPVYIYMYTRDIEALVKRLCARGMALTRDRDDLQLLNSLEAARSPHVPARIQVSNLEKDDEEEGKRCGMVKERKRMKDRIKGREGDGVLKISG